MMTRTGDRCRLRTCVVLAALALVATGSLAGCRGEPKAVREPPAADSSAASKATAVKPAPAPAPIATPAAKPAEKPAEKPVVAAPRFLPPDSALKAGSELVYRREHVYETGDEKSADASFVRCSLLPTEGDAAADSFRARCPKVEAGMNAAILIWMTHGTYQWKEDGLWFLPDAQLPDDLSVLALREAGLVYARKPDASRARAKKVDLAQEQVDAFCTVPPVIDDEERGDDSGESLCFDLRHGPLVSNRYFSGGFYEDETYLLVAVVAGAPEAKDRAAADTAEKLARAGLETWLAAQNSGDLAAYSALYVPSFRGVRRTERDRKTFDLAGWLADRKKMFAKPMVVTADDLQVVSTATETRVLFTQGWSSGKYADKGKKEIVFDTAAPARILREEMLTAYSVAGR